jgi:hypothetical protein
MDTNSLITRLTRVLRFDASVFREIASDQSALSQAIVVVAVAAILTGLGGIGAAGQVGMVGIIVIVILGIVGSLIGYALYAAVAAFVARTFFQGRTDFQEMARTLGFAYIWNGLGILGLVPFLGGIVAWVGSVLAIVAGVLALRESAEFDMTKAVITAVIAGVVAGFATFCATAIVGAPILLMLGVAAGSGQ